MVYAGVIEMPPPLSFLTRTCVTPFIFPGFCFLRNRVRAAETRFTGDFFFARFRPEFLLRLTENIFRPVSVFSTHEFPLSMAS